MALVVNAQANAPDPVLSGSAWNLQQSVGYDWYAGKEPPSVWMRPAINAGAADSNAAGGSSFAFASKIATFGNVSGSASKFSYETTNNCFTPSGIACAWQRNAPTSFWIKFIAQGVSMPFGTMKWCQWYPAQSPPQTPPSNCYDVENIALDELGHVLLLNHHSNPDYSDAVVQETAQTGLSVPHSYGECDLARLQAIYGMLTSSKLYALCLARSTPGLTFSASATSVTPGTTVTFTATLTTPPTSLDDNYGNRISQKPAHARTVKLQVNGVDYATMTPGVTAGTYTYSVSIGFSAQWRAYFAQPANEGFLGTATSAAVTVSCPACPQ